MLEGLAETLTVKRFGVSKSLERTLSTTNPIENLNGGIRNVIRRVKRWRGGDMVVRWVAAGAIECSRGFRRVRGYKSLPKLEAALRRHQLAIQGDEPVVAQERMSA